MNLQARGDEQERTETLNIIDESRAEQICIDTAQDLSLFPVGHANYASSSSADAIGIPDTSHDAEYAQSLLQEDAATTSRST